MTDITQVVERDQNAVAKKPGGQVDADDDIAPCGRHCRGQRWRHPLG